MTAQELIAAIEAFAPLASQENWDNSGIAVGNPVKEVDKALIALDCTEEVMDEAVSLQCDIIITHHPLIFEGVKSITPDTFQGRVIEKAIRNDIVVYAAHTNMDKAVSGVSGLMADTLGLKCQRPLSEDGFGVIGELSTPLMAQELIKKVKEGFNVLHARTSRPVSGKISRVAVCGGSGRSFIKKARQEGAQIYITGDITYHEFYCEEGFMVMDIGHYNSEYDVVRLFANILCEKFPNFATLISRKNNNPIYYY